MFHTNDTYSVICFQRENIVLAQVTKDRILQIFNKMLTVQVLDLTQLPHVYFPMSSITNVLQFAFKL